MVARSASALRSPDLAARLARRDRNGKPGVTRGRKATGLAQGGSSSQPGYRKEDPMTFWDGTRWVPDAPTGDRPHP